MDAWNINQKGIALGNFASALLHALKHKGGPYENPVRRVRMVMQAFEEQEENAYRANERTADVLASTETFFLRITSGMPMRQ